MEIEEIRLWSLWQPWASLVQVSAIEPRLGKHIETRGKYHPYRGLVGIHATKNFPAFAREMAWGNPHMRRALQCLGPYRPEHLDELPRGAIIARVRVVACVRTRQGSLDSRIGPWPEPKAGTPEHAFGDYSPGRFMYFMDEIKALSEPIPYQGQQGGFKRLPLEVIREINRRVIE